MQYTIHNKTYNIFNPENITEESLLNDCHQHLQQNLPEPFWKIAWPTLPELIKVIEKLNGTNKTCIELGCGLGVGSIAATLSNFTVTATDYFEEALSYTHQNVYNNTGKHINTQVLDFTQIPNNLTHYDLVIGSDILYTDQYQLAVPNAIYTLLKPDGICYISDNHRRPIILFLRECQKLELKVTIKSRSTEPSLITVYEITK